MSSSKYYDYDYDYDLLMIDDDDHDSNDDSSILEDILDTKWINDIENEITLKEYEMMLKTDILRVSFQIIYLERDKQTIEYTVAYLYTLREPNQITQSELFHIICRFQKKKKYYNLLSLLFYDFRLSSDSGSGDDSRWLSTYLSQSSDGFESQYARVIEYKNILSIDTIYFCPLISMFHNLIGFTILLFDD